MGNEKQQSCHPRVVNGRTQFPKVNTAMPRRKGIRADKLANMQKHAEEHPNCGQTRARLSELAKG